MIDRILLTACSLFVSVAAQAAPVQWGTGSGGNGHWYDFVITGSDITATDAEAAAESSVFMGETGYLATITSAAEQAFLNTIWPGSGSVAGQFNSYSYFLIGASDRNIENSFEWIGGSEDGDALVYDNFKPGEPNDFSGGEDYVVAWWEDSLTGFWNDVSGQNVRAYLVEYDQSATMAPIPVPAGLPLLVLGIGALSLLRRKRKL